MAKVLIIGKGGREHALYWKLKGSSHVGKIYCVPGNGGIPELDRLDINVSKHEELSTWCLRTKVDLVVVGPEDPLAAGIVDHFLLKGIPCFGPSASAAELESSKSFAKSFMERHRIPTARWATFTNLSEAENHIRTADYSALVIKASGLACGKGVIVADDVAGAVEAVKEMLGPQKKFGKAGETVVVEEKLVGPEVSVIGFCDGKTIRCFPPAQDHKRLYNGNIGPNTGGMGAYAPCPIITTQEFKAITSTMQRVVNGMADEGRPYSGVLYGGFMITPDGPKVLEFNCRLGDPEAQVLLHLMASDLYTVMTHCVEGRLSDCPVDWVQDSYAVGVVLASEGYPSSPQKGHQIKGADGDLGENVTVFHAGTRVTQNDMLVTDGGRVMTVVAVDKDLQAAAFQAQRAASRIDYEGKCLRTDIAAEGINKLKKLTYKDSGVDIMAGEALVKSIKSFTSQTYRPGCVGELGGFGAVFDLKNAKPEGFKDPQLVMGTDGVGTKLKIAKETEIYHTIGIDLVAMCVNDILCHGAEPLSFLDYYSTGKLDVDVAKQVVEGIAAGCKMAGCALVGGETAEMPGIYAPGIFDLAGFAVGVVERELYLPQITKIQDGDIMYGIPSSGVHSNGFSLVRRVVENAGLAYDDGCPWDPSKTIGEALLTPTKVYCKALLPLINGKKIKALAHITGGGLLENIPRVLPENLAVELDASKWTVLPVFKWIMKVGDIEPLEMAKTFNLGIGMVVITSSVDRQAVSEEFKDSSSGGVLCEIGRVRKQEHGYKAVEIKNLEVSLSTNELYTIPTKPGKQVKRVAVLISGTGTNLQALIKATRDGTCPSAEIVLVISNKADALGLKRAEEANIRTERILHKKRELLENDISDALQKANIDIVCLAGFMRIVSASFVKNWEGRILNIHPSILPSFKGMNAIKQALDGGVRKTGCTVHFVNAEVDDGAIIVQEDGVEVCQSDSEETLAQKVRVKEHIAYPKALELVASGKVTLCDGKLKEQH